jgi:hypothetical protein
VTEPRDDLSSKVEKWVNEKGYPFEMRVAAAFRKAGFRVTQSQYYTDTDTGTAREIDLVADIQKPLGSGVLRIEFVVECKVTADKPWLLFCAPEIELPKPARVAQRYSSKAGTIVLSKLAVFEDVQENEVFRLRQPLGYGMTQALGKEDRDSAYVAMCCVSGAVRSMTARWDLHPRRDTIVEFFLPVIAISGRLFAASLEDSGKINVRETAEGTVVWRNAPGHLSNTIISIVTQDSLGAFAVELFEGCKKLLEKYGDLAKDVIKPKGVRFV